ncbi:MAG: SDR family oxidoreductase [Azoarcus sp.]|nr:SDR family oxidoreductase [Azoarcus sp.]
MNVFLCGADGFLGRAIQRTLAAAGHHVTRGVRRPRLPGDIAIDYRRDLAPEDWLPRLEGMDAVINAVGILREQRADDFARIHHRAPAALFRAAAMAGVGKTVQISALGAPAALPYLASKYAADAALLETLPENATVLRPALVFGQEGVSTRFFMALASLPILCVPRGAGELRPVHVDDVAATVAACLAAPAAASRVLRLPGPRALGYAEWMETYRALMKLPPAPHLPVPGFFMAAAARCAGMFRASLLSRDTWAMMRHGNRGDAEEAPLFPGQTLRDPAAFAPPEDAGRLRLAALAAWRRPMLVSVLAAIWLLTALASVALHPVAESLALLRPFGLAGAAAATTLALAAALDALMGVLTLCRPGRKLWLFQLALVAAYTLLICWRLPEFLFHPFGPVLKNLAVAAIIIQLYAEETAS